MKTTKILIVLAISFISGLFTEVEAQDYYNHYYFGYGVDDKTKTLYVTPVLHKKVDLGCNVNGAF